MDAILTDSHLDTRLKIVFFFKCDGTKARVCSKSLGREREVRKTTVNSVDDSS